MHFGWWEAQPKTQFLTTFSFQRTMDWNCTKWTYGNQIEGIWELANEWAQCRASKWVSGASKRAHAHSEQCVASTWVRGARERMSRMNGPLLFTSFFKSSYPVCDGSSRLKMTIWSWIQRRISKTEKCCIFAKEGNFHMEVIRAIKKNQSEYFNSSGQTDFSTEWS